MHVFCPMEGLTPVVLRSLKKCHVRQGEWRKRERERGEKMGTARGTCFGCDFFFSSVPNHLYDVMIFRVSWVIRNSEKSTGNLFLWSVHIVGFTVNCDIFFLKIHPTLCHASWTDLSNRWSCSKISLRRKIVTGLWTSSTHTHTKNAANTRCLEDHTSKCRQGDRTVWGSLCCAWWTAPTEVVKWVIDWPSICNIESSVV